MEEESEEEAGSPFWLSESRRNRSASDILLSTRLHLTILLVIAMLFMFIVTPSLVSQTRRLFSPSSFKRRWDFLNLLLVVFAVFCGFIGKEDGKDDSENRDFVRSSQNMRSGQRQYDWNNYGDAVRLGSLKRASSSYPDLTRHDAEYDQRPRYYDDLFPVMSPGSVSVAPPSMSSPPPATASIGGRKPSRQEFERVEIRPPPPPLATGSGDIKGRDDRRRGKDMRKTFANLESLFQPPPPPPPLPPPSYFDDIFSSSKKPKSSKKYKTVPPPPPPLPPPSYFNNIFSSSKKPKSSKKYITVPPPPPPPPPPKPWPKKQRGNVRESSLIPPPPPPPPFKVPPWKFRVQGDYVKVNSSPDRSSEGTSYTTAGYTSSESSWSSPAVSRKKYQTLPPPPPPPPKSAMQVGNKGKSPLIPPPPQPPPRWKFAVGGDYNDITRRPNNNSESPTYTAAGNTSSESFWSDVVRRDYVEITNSPGSSEGPTYTAAGNTSSEPFWSDAVREDYVEITNSPASSSEDTTYTAVGKTSSESLLSRPDVNTEAGDFIARFRAKLELEKSNSLNRRNSQGGD